MKIQSVIFDFDGTVADTLPYILKIVNNHAHEFGFSPFTKEKFAALRSKSYVEILIEFKFSFFKVPLLVQQGRKELEQYMPKVKPFPDIDAAMKRLKKLGLTIGILKSNSVMNVEIFLKKNGIDYIDFIHSEKHLFGKANALRNVMQRHKLRSDEVLYVGDEVRDIEACRKNHIKIISVTWGFNSRELLEKHHPDYLVDNPQEIMHLIDTLSYNR